jgi:peptidoglycan-associated lipoprotein
MKRAVFAVLVGAALVIAPGCATKKFVNTRMGHLNDKVQALTSSAEATQARVQKNEQQIARDEQRTAAVEQKADAARTAADGAMRTATGAAAKAESVERASKRLVYELVMSENESGFQFAGADLPEGVKTRLDALVAQLKDDGKGAYFESEGHTDATGPEVYNVTLGLERARSVQTYLYQHDQIPLHKISIISYGETRPVASNATREGRAQNRRIVVRLLE